MAEQDDAGNEYLQYRQRNYVSDYDRLMQAEQEKAYNKQEQEKRAELYEQDSREDDGVGLPLQFWEGVKSTAETTGDVISDVYRSVPELAPAIVSGSFQAFNETITSINDFGEYLEDKIGIPNMHLNFNAFVSDEDFFTKERPEGDLFPELKESETVTAGMVEGITQFLVGFIGSKKITSGIMWAAPTSKKGKAAKAMLDGAIADSVVFSPHEERLANLVQSHPSLGNPVTEYLAAKPEDTVAEGRFKNALEGLMLGGVAEAVFRGVKFMRDKRLELKERKRQRELEKAVEAQEGGVPEFEPVENKIADPNAPLYTFTKSDREADVLGDTEGLDAKPEYGTGDKKALLEDALNINYNRLETTDDVLELITEVARHYAPDINAARREKMSHEQTMRLADEVGLTPKQLSQRRRGQMYNAEEALAARRIMMASGQKVMDLAKIAAHTQSKEDYAAFRIMMQKHQVIQAQVQGMTAEAGRLLQSFRIRAKSAKEQQEMIDALAENDKGFRNIGQLAENFSTFTDLVQINTATNQALRARKRDAIMEIWINGLLSSLPTHAVNITSNAMTAFWRPMEKLVARPIGMALNKETDIAAGEAQAHFWAIFKAVPEAIKVATTTARTGGSALQRQKNELIAEPAFRGETFGLYNNWGKAVDYLGTGLRLPSRALLTMDDFFKTVGYRAELHSRAYRIGVGEGLEGKALAERIQEVMSEPPRDLEIEGREIADYQTFTNQLGETGQALQKGIQKLELGGLPIGKVLVPFFRTPMNIMKFTLERSPMAPLLKHVRDEIAQGGPKGDMAMARIALGSTLMATISSFAAEGHITGSGPANRDLRKTLEATGWRPYSLKIGDKYYSYSRLDPIGMTIGLAADITQILGDADVAQSGTLAAASTVAVAQNLFSKTYMKGISDFIAALTDTSSDSEQRTMKMMRWGEKQVASLVPYSAALRSGARLADPTLRDAQGVVEHIKAMIPGYSDELPPRRNIFGEPIHLEGGLGFDIVTPVYTSTDKKDPVADEVVKQRTILRMPNRKLNGVRLDNHQFDKYMMYVSGKDNPFVDKPLHKAFEDLFASNEYLMATDGQDGTKSVMIKTIYSSYKNAAAQALLESDETYREEYRVLEQQAGEAATGEPVEINF